ncbi:response regulator transcription factor [Shewanella sp. WXL01]|uniref:Response regulator transcription factor n=1 Tax=Shewanella maritima TaxID=2520507 RepID=A0A411PFZ7_9GAMM|nr:MULTISPECIES: LuxR C-terminal-related transcriptional regulator [Shewanella]NKF49406.1 response regulator transcription factor [Shewanella sp. WXL01]QBF82483.1 response regulator transcription factor [Shewanella maritima]
MLDKQMLLVDLPDELIQQFSHIAKLLGFAINTVGRSMVSHYVEQFSNAGSTAIIIRYIQPEQVELSRLTTNAINKQYHLAVSSKLTTELELSLIASGFNGAVSADANAVELLQAANTLLDEHIHYSQAATSRYVLQNKRVPSYQNSTKLLALTTPKEQQVLSLIWSGLTNEQMASKLGISINTVKMHIQNIYKKTNIKSRGQLFALTSDHG